MSLYAGSRLSRFGVAIAGVLAVVSVNCNRASRTPAPGVYRGAPVILDDLVGVLQRHTQGSEHLAVEGHKICIQVRGRHYENDVLLCDTAQQVFRN